jgi:hypothetical protein
VFRSDTIRTESAIVRISLGERTRSICDGVFPDGRLTVRDDSGVIVSGAVDPDQGMGRAMLSTRDVSALKQTISEMGTKMDIVIEESAAVRGLA